MIQAPLIDPADDRRLLRKVAAVMWIITGLLIAAEFVAVPPGWHGLAFHAAIPVSGLGGSIVLWCSRNGPPN